jgi:hypothetical protein
MADTLKKLPDSKVFVPFNKDRGAIFRAGKITLLK